MTTIQFRQHISSFSTNIDICQERYDVLYKALLTISGGGGGGENPHWISEEMIAFDHQYNTCIGILHGASFKYSPKTPVLQRRTHLTLCTAATWIRLYFQHRPHPLSVSRHTTHHPLPFWTALPMTNLVHKFMFFRSFKKEKLNKNKIKPQTLLPFAVLGLEPQRNKPRLWFHDFPHRAVEPCKNSFTLL